MYRIPGGPGNIADDRPLLSHKSVQQRRLAGIGLTDDRKLRHTLLTNHLLVLCDQADYGVEQFTRSAATHRRQKKYIFKTKTIKLSAFQQPVTIVNLIDGQENRLGRPAKHISHGLIQCGDTRRRVHHKDQRIGLFKSDQHLLFYLDLKNILTLRDKTTRIDQVKTLADPFGHTILPVTRHTAHVIYNSLALFEQTIEKCAFPHIGPAYNGHCKSAHILINYTRTLLRKYPYPSTSASPSQTIPKTPSGQ